MNVSLFTSVLEMEVPHLHLSHFQAFNLTPAYRLRFLFLFFTIFILILWIAPSSGACKDEIFKCGTYFYGYPFGSKNSGCGDPALQLDCDHRVQKPFLNISGYKYYIGWPHQSLMPSRDSRHIMNIIDQNLLGDICNPSSSKITAQFWSTPQFHITGEYENITLFQQCSPEMMRDLSPLPCNHSWYYNTSNFYSLESKCELQVVLPVRKFEGPIQNQTLHKGLKIKWNVSENCRECDSNGGHCAYNKSSMQFCCECSGKRCANKCPSVAGKSKTKIIIIGVAFGSIALLLTGLLLVIVHQKRSEIQLSNVEKFLQEYVHQMPNRYSYPQLKKITNKFAHRVGEGGFGVVYKGKLQSGNLVAIKMLDRSRHSEDQFMNEVATIGRIHHVNLVPLMGYCYEGIINALVYEYMPNGSLDKFIFAERQELSWEQLYSIALGAARGIAYLHDDCNRRIIHFDIKPHNILLDADFTPKVADFGLAKLCRKKDEHISMTAARGTPGYVAPEVWSNSGPATDKSEVYSFGMVLLEMVGGRTNFDDQVSRSSQIYFPEWAFKLLENGELETPVRGRGKAEIEYGDEEIARRLAKVGLWCIQYNSTDRPSMNRVIQMLERNGDDVTLPPIPFRSSIFNRDTLSIDSVLNGDDV